MNQSALVSGCDDLTMRGTPRRPVVSKKLHQIPVREWVGRHFQFHNSYINFVYFCSSMRSCLNNILSFQSNSNSRIFEKKTLTKLWKIIQQLLRITFCSVYIRCLVEYNHTFFVWSNFRCGSERLRCWRCAHYSIIRVTFQFIHPPVATQSSAFFQVNRGWIGIMFDQPNEIISLMTREWKTEMMTVNTHDTTRPVLMKTTFEIQAHISQDECLLPISDAH